jgi:hypothetical protein
MGRFRHADHSAVQKPLTLIRTVFAMPEVCVVMKQTGGLWFGDIPKREAIHARTERIV